MQKLKRNSNPRNRVGCYESAKAKFKNPRCGQACHAKAKAQTDQGVSNSFRIAWPTTISQENTKTQALHPKTRINACNRPLHKIPTPQSASQNISKIADQFQKHTYQSLSVVQLPGGSSVHSSLFVCASKSSI